MHSYGVGSDLTSRCPKTAAVPKQGPVFPAAQVRFGPIRASRGIDGGGLVAEEKEAGLSLYSILGIPVSGSAVEIKQAYKKMARKYHPDVSPPDQVDEYTERFIRVHEAYETLSDPHRRAIYDRDMGNGTGRGFKYQEEEKREWRRRWQSQLSELKRRRSTINNNKSSKMPMSWAARIRSQKEHE